MLGSSPRQAPSSRHTISLADTTLSPVVGCFSRVIHPAEGNLGSPRGDWKEAILENRLRDCFHCVCRCLRRSGSGGRCGQSATRSLRSSMTVVGSSSASSP
jgi:hypothetical protein